MKKLVSKFKALSSVDRLRIINLFLKRKKRICVCEICNALHLPFYNVSRNLRELKIAGLLQEEREGKYIYYQLFADDLNAKIFRMLSTVSDPLLDEDLKNFQSRDNFCKPEKYGE